MPGTLLITHPAGAAAVLILTLLLAIVVRRRRVGRLAQTTDQPRHTSLAFHLTLWLMALAASLVTVLYGSAGLHRWLTGLSLLSAGWLTIELYRHEDVSAGWRRLLALLRWSAWAALLVLLARPTCEQHAYIWDRPVLAVLLDQSASLAIVDSPAPTTTQPSRAAQINAALQRTEATQPQLKNRFDVRLFGVGAHSTPLNTWHVNPQQPHTALGAALQDAGELRSGNGRPPAAIILLSDGAENVADERAVLQAAAELERQRTRLITVGVGPEPGEMPAVMLDPLAIPARVSLRDILRIPVSGRATGCTGHSLTLELAWDDEVTASEPITVNTNRQNFVRTFEILPPGAGVHRLTARVTLPEELGSTTYSTSTVVDVVGERIRVTYVERVPHHEGAFTLRAWQTDPAIEAQRILLAAPAGMPRTTLADQLAGSDVVVLGHVGAHLTADDLNALYRAVIDRGVGLLLAGGSELLNNAGYVGSELAELSPLELLPEPGRDGVTTRLLPTASGLRHPIFAPPPANDDDVSLESPTDIVAAFEALPPVIGVGAVGPPKPAAVVLARDEREQPFLAAQEVGRGRCVLAGWESTWPWSLASDVGNRLHHHLWRQLVLWLANRRPQAWVMVDQPRYVLAALEAGQSTIRIQAGISGHGPPGTPIDPADFQVSLRLQAAAADGDSTREPHHVPLSSSGDSWHAQLPDLAGRVPKLEAGAYTLEFFIRHTGDDTEHEAVEYTARTRFEVVTQDAERRPPTANLPLLRAAGKRTTEVGGGYVALSELPAVLAELAQSDQRERIMQTTRTALIETEPWLWLGWLVVALGAEWAVRKRCGLT